MIWLINIGLLILVYLLMKLDKVMEVKRRKRMEKLTERYLK